MAALTIHRKSQPELQLVEPVIPTKIVSIAVDKVIGSDFNPVTRITNIEKLSGLRESMDAQGQLNPIAVVDLLNGSFQIGDGHRRYQVALELGFTHINAIVHQARAGETPQQCVNRLFVELNKSTKPFNGRDQLNVALQGGPIFSPSIKSAKNQLETIFTDSAEIDSMVRQEITTTVLNLAKKSTKYVLEGSGIGEGTPTFMRRLAVHIRYLLRNNVQQPVTVYMRLKHDKDKLKEAIDNNRPPPYVSSDKLKESWVDVNGKVKKTRKMKAKA